MGKILCTLLMAGITSFAIAQKSEMRQVKPFSAVSAAEGVDVILQKGNKESVKVEVAENADIARVITEVSGSYLKIHMKSGQYKGSLHVRVYVTYVKLEKIIGSSAANIFSQEAIKADKLELRASSAASLELTVDVNELTCDASSAGEMELEGKTREVHFDASSAAKIDGYDLQADIVKANASSAGSIKVTVINELYAEASSGGDIRYRGNALKTHTNANSGGSVKKAY